MKSKSINILLPTDFSDNSWNAVVYALKLYEDQFCNFYFLHASKFTSSKMAIITAKLTQSIDEVAQKELTELKTLAEASNANANHRFDTILSHDSIIDAIEKSIQNYKIDLVVMGTKGASGAKAMLFGSNTVKVIKRMRLVPVLIVPDEYDFIVPKQIAFPTDFNRKYNDKVINAITNLGLLYNSRIRIVHIEKEKNLSDIQQDNMEALKNYLIDFEHSFHWMPDYTNMSNVINVFIEELKIDMLVMVNYKHSFLENINNEPVVANIGFHPTVPFLVIPD